MDGEVVRGGVLGVGDVDQGDGEGGGDGGGRAVHGLDHGDLLRRLNSQGRLHSHVRRRRAVVRGRLGVAKLVVHVLVPDAAVVGKAGEIVEHFTAVLALVDFVSSVGVDVGSQVVSSGVATATDVAGKGFLSSVDPHVPAQVSGAYELAFADLAGEGSVRLQLLPLLLRQRLHVHGDELPLHHEVPLPPLHERVHHLAPAVWRGHGCQEVEVVPRALGVHGGGGGGEGGAEAAPLYHQRALHLGCEGRGLSRGLSGRGVELPAVAVQVRSSVELLSTQEALLHLDVSVENGMAVQVVCSVEPLATNLTEELLVVGVGVGEDVPLELVLAVEALPTDLARDGDLLVLPAFEAGQHVAHHLQRLGGTGVPLDERQALLVYRVASQESSHEGFPGDGAGQPQHVVVLASVDGRL